MKLLSEVLKEADQKDPMWFAYGSFFGRYDEERIKAKIPQSVIVKACDLAAADDDDALEDLFEEVGFNKEHAINTMWEDYSPLKVKKQILSGKPFNASAEEFVFGYGKTANQAKAQYLDIEDEGEDDWGE